jgi:hypothetical protein
MIPDIIEATGMLPRGLAHPIVFAGPDAMRGGGAPPADGAAASSGEGGAGGFASLLATYGAVPVSAFAM